MKTQDIKNIASAYKQVQEKAKMDKVNPDELKGTHGQRKDKDIDNDGDVDKSDEYLHNRRKAIKTAMKNEADQKKIDTSDMGKWYDKNYPSKKSMKKEEVEELDEISRDLATRAAQGFADKADKAHDKKDYSGFKKGEAGRKLAIAKVQGRAKVPAVARRVEEVEELDELSKKTLGSYVKKASSAAASDAAKYGQQGSSEKGLGHFRKAYNRLDNIRKATDRLTKEEVEELDELSKKTLGSYVKKATGDAVTKAYKAGDVRDKDSGNNYMKALQRQIGISKATSKLAKEEVELDEDISKMSHGRLKWHMNTGTPHGSYSNSEMKAERDRRMKHVDSADAYKKAKPGLSEAKDGDGANIVRDKEFKGKSLLGKTPVPYKPANPDGPHYSTGKKSMKKEDADMSMKEKLQVQKESILEREMTDAEKKKREDIVMGMKKNKADLEKRYGSRWKDVMYATATKQAMESVDNALTMTKNLLTTKESFKTETTNWPVYARIKEANDRAMHYKGATPPETMDDKMTASDKAFIDPHGGLKGTDSGIDGAKAAEYTAKHATDGIKPGGGMNRTNDQKVGDKNIIKSTEAK